MPSRRDFLKNTLMVAAEHPDVARELHAALIAAR
jgi:hypothetical protein